MLILAFESSCDDTAVAVVRETGEVLSSVGESQINHHTRYGGVVPEIAARLHAEAWQPVLDQALAEAGVEMSDIDLIGVTAGPGLQTSLLTGTTAASYLGLLYQIPVMPTHHILGHIVSVDLFKKGQKAPNIEFPALTLVLSGGHSQFFLRTENSVQLLGTKRDDACGEAYDKVAKMLGLGYPGGPIVSQYAERGNSQAFELPLVALEKETLDFSFSGLKEAVRRIVVAHDGLTGAAQERFRANICASFQACVERTIVHRLKRALQLYPDIQQVHLVGGVAANTGLRNAMQNFLEPKGLSLITPQDFSYCTDNAAMIGRAASLLSQKSPDKARLQYVDAKARWELDF